MTPQSETTEKKTYTPPDLTVYGSAEELTLKTGSLNDQNQGNNGMYWSAGM